MSKQNRKCSKHKKQVQKIGTKMHTKIVKTKRENNFNNKRKNNNNKCNKKNDEN